MSRHHLSGTHNGSSGPVQHTASEFATDKATQGQTLTKQVKPPARQDDGTVRDAPKGPPQHKV